MQHHASIPAATNTVYYIITVHSITIYTYIYITLNYLSEQIGTYTYIIYTHYYVPKSRQAMIMNIPAEQVPKGLEAWSRLLTAEQNKEFSKVHQNPYL